MKNTKENIDLLKKLGFSKKPFEGYPDTWWFDGEPIFDMNSVKDFPSLIRVCLISYTDAVKETSSISDTKRKETINKILSKLLK